MVITYDSITDDMNIIVRRSTGIGYDPELSGYTPPYEYNVVPGTKSTVQTGIVLNKRNGFSTAITEDLAKTVEISGKTYEYYYWLEEENVPSGWTVSYSVDGSSGVRIGNSITVTNRKKEVQYGALKLTKKVTVNGQAPGTSTMADGTYTFTIHSVADGKTTTNDKTVTITVTNGSAVSATGGIFDPEAKYVTVSNLTEGDYTITEEKVPGMTTTVSGGKENKNNETENAITVTVKAGENIAATAQATFTNDRAMTSFNFSKIWLGPTGNIKTSTSYQDWQENITVTIKRKQGASGAEDNNFALKYTITSGSGSFSPITEENQSKLPTDEGTLNALTLIGSGSGKVFNFELPEESLRKYNDDGTEWVYYVVEEKLDDYAPPAYGTSTTVESTTTYSITNGAQDAKDGGVIVNQTFGGYELPSTGGPGTLPYTLGGIALIMASALMYRFRMRRREGG